MAKWYVWGCKECGATMTINYFATEEDYSRFKSCGCKGNGVMEYQSESEDGEC